MKKLLIALALISVSFAANATTTIDQMTTGPGNLLGTEEIPFVYPANTGSFKTTSQQIANLGGGTPFSVTAFGAVCDGGVIPAGIVTTSGSPNISLEPSVLFQYPVQWSLAPGDKITLSSPAQLDTFTPPSNTQILTVVSATSTTAVLNGNVNFTSSSFQFASAVYYKTVNTTAIQNAINAAYATGVGGNVTVPQGGCATGNIVYPYSQVKLSGAGPESSILILANGSNSDLLTSFQFSTLTNSGTFSSGGAMNWDIEDIGLNGNKGANTGTNIGSNIGTGDLLRFYGASFYMNRVSFNAAAADDMYSEWNNGAGDPLNTAFSLNSYPQNLMFANQNGWAWVNNGPHDSYSLNSSATNCGTGGIKVYGFGGLGSGNGSPFHIVNWHSYQCPIDLDMNVAVTADQSQFEDTVIVRGFDFSATDSNIGLLQLGATTTASAAFNVKMVNTGVSTLRNWTDSGFQDEWIGGSLAATTTDSIPYNPWYTFGVQNNANNNQTSAWFNGVSFGGVGNQGIGIVRPCCGRNHAGYNLTMNAGGATSGQANLNGGDLILQSGLSTGLGTSGMSFQVFAATTSGTTDNTATTALRLTSSGNVGIGVTAPADRLDINGAFGLTTTTATIPVNGAYLPSANTLALATNGAASIEVNAVGHQIVAGTTPTVASGATACGTSPTIAGTDNSGAVVTGTSPSGSCVVIFANPWTAAPDSCGCTNNTSVARGCSALSISTTSFALVATTSPHTGGDSLGYSCRSHQF